MKDTRILDLEDMIRDYSTQYYLGEPLISDREFDNLVEELKVLDPANKLLTSTGWGMIMEQVRDKADHYYQMTGLPKLKSEDEDLVSDHSSSSDFVTYKMDGCAVEIILDPHGGIPRVITRGDGSQGQDVTSKFSLMWDEVDIELAIQSGIKSLTAEVVMANEDRDPGTVTHTRNIVAGMLSRKEVNPQEFKDKLKVLVHGTVARYSVGGQVDSKYDHETLSELGFEVVPLVESKDDKVLDLTGSTVIDIDGKSYSVDGLVVSPEFLTYDSDGKLDNKSVAIKSVTEYADTVVTGIDWNMTRTGTLVPVVKFEPIVLNGATVRRAAGSSHQNIVSKGIGLWSEVRVIRSGEIIPYISEVLVKTDDHAVPETCPHCGRPTVVRRARLQCSKPDLCREVGRLKLHHFILSLVDIDSLGGYVIDLLLDAQDPEIRTPEDLYDINIKDYENRQDRSVTDMLLYKLLVGIRTDVKLGQLLTGLGIPSFGWGSYDRYGNVLYKYLTYAEPYFSKDSLDRPKGVRQISHDYIVKNRVRLSNLVHKSNATLEDRLSTKYDDANRLKLCITGSLNRYSSRAKVFEDYMDKVEESDIKKADYLVTNSTRVTSKYKYASENNIKIITEAQLYELLEE